jgi:hypothetical protein
MSKNSVIINTGILFFILILFLLLPNFNFATAADPPECECTSGDCCDGCNFLSSSNSCKNWDTFGCFQGTGCNANETAPVAMGAQLTMKQ